MCRQFAQSEGCQFFLPEYLPPLPLPFTPETPLSLREREGPAAKQWEGEGLGGKSVPLALPLIHPLCGHLLPHRGEGKGAAKPPLPVTAPEYKTERNRRSRTPPVRLLIVIMHQRCPTTWSFMILWTHLVCPGPAALTRFVALYRKRRNAPFSDHDGGGPRQPAPTLGICV